MDDINNPHYKLVKSVFEFKARDIKGDVVPLNKYKGNVCIFVNIASKSLFAPYTYKLLNETYDAFEVKGLKILAFPCNQFNNEEPGAREEIQQCFNDVGARFDLFDKINVNGENAHQLYKYIKIRLPNEKTKLGVIKDNFTIFLFSKKGDPFIRLEPPASKDELYKNISSFLGDPIPSETEASKPWKKKHSSQSKIELITSQAGQDPGQIKSKTGPDPAQSKSITVQGSVQSKSTRQSLDQSKSQTGPDLAQSESQTGPDPGQIKSQTGQDPGQIKSQTGQDPAQSKSITIQGSVQSKSTRQSLDQSKSQTGPDLAQSKSQTGPDPAQSKSQTRPDPAQSKSQTGKDPAQIKSMTGKDPAQKVIDF